MNSFGTKVKSILRTEKIMFAVGGLFLILIIVAIKEFSEKVWEANKTIPLVQNNEIYQPNKQFLSVKGGYEGIWKVPKENNLEKKILPENRVVAYYGNLSSKGMGVLGEYPEDEVLQRLLAEVDKWSLSDPETPAIPALHYIATVAQSYPGVDGKYRSRMSSKQIDRVISMADKIGAIVFLDVQIGGSDLESEVTRLKKYLELPQVHLGIDPEFAMAPGDVPGTYIGTLSAEKINYAINFLSEIVRENNLTPKILVVHRFTEGMITDYKDITPTPEVQVVINMDGFGHQSLKKNTYKQYVGKHPIEFTGFKIFYKNDLWTEGSRLMQPEDLLKLDPVPAYIQYQ
jgi:hypothetical protein